MAEQRVAMRRSLDALLPFLMGLVLGIFGALMPLTARIATLEANDVAKAEAIREMKTDLHDIATEIHRQQRP